MAIDIVARGLALSMLGADGKVSADKMPTLKIPSGEGVDFTPVGALTDVNWIKGRTTEEVLYAILFGLVNPILTEPSFNIELTSSNIITAFEPTIIEGMLHFNRGEIIAADGSSIPRTGAATKYTVWGVEQENIGTDVPFSIECTLGLGEHDIPATVEFAEGAQPVDSLGNPYSESYAAGQLSAAARIKAVSALATADNENIDFIYFHEDSGEGYQITTTAEANNKKQTFKLSLFSPIVGIKQFNIMNQSWEWINGSPEKSLLTFDVAYRDDYVIYTHNGSKSGVRELQLYTKIEE